MIEKVLLLFQKKRFLLSFFCVNGPSQ